MKHLPRLLALALAATMSGASAEDAPPLNVGVLVEYYELEHKLLPGMLRQYQQDPDASALLKKVQQLQKDGEAKLVDSSYTITVPGQRSKVESIREHIYPTEYDPAEIPQTLTGPIDPDTVISTPSSPTAFDVRNIGQTFEFEPAIDQSNTFLTLDIAPDRVTFEGENIWSHGIGAAQQPIFDAARTQTKILIKLDGCELFGTFLPPGEKSSKRVLGFVSTICPRSGVKEAPEKADPVAEPSQISLITEFIEVDAALASVLIRKLAPPSDPTTIRASLDEALADGSAKLIETNTALGVTGQRVSAKSIREYIYPTSADPPELPQTLTGPIDPKLDMITPSSPTAFDVRDIGVRVELEAHVRNDEHGPPVIGTNILTSSVKLVGERSYSTGRAAVRQPLFETMQIHTSVTLSDGKPFLLGMHGLETARAGKSANEKEKQAVAGRRVLVFITPKIKSPK